MVIALIQAALVFAAAYLMGFRPAVNFYAYLLAFILVLRGASITSPTIIFDFGIVTLSCFAILGHRYNSLRKIFQNLDWRLNFLPLIYAYFHPLFKFF